MEAESTLAPGRLLIVDDSELVREILGEKLAGAGYQVEAAASGSEALDVLVKKGRRFDLVVLDIVMPEMDGFEVARQLRQDPESRSTPILMLTELQSNENIVRGLEVGADDFLNKSVSDEELTARVRSLIALGRIRESRTVVQETVTGLFQRVSRGKDEKAALQAQRTRIAILHPSSEKLGHLVTFLEQKEREVVLLDTQKGVLPALNQIEPDLVLAGFEAAVSGTPSLLQALQRGEASLPVIVVDEQFSPERRIAAYNAGADDYLSGNTSAEELEARVSSVMRRSRRHRTMEVLRDRAVTAATIDPLTGIYNRAFFNAHIDFELIRARRAVWPLTLVMMDIDHFKSINDTWGHPVGDLVLKELAGRVVRSTRDNDIVARYGGDEIVAVLPETSLPNGLKVAERIRMAIGQAPFGILDGDRITVTVSFGVATYPTNAADLAGLVALADRALYQAKEKGRNCVVGIKQLADGSTGASKRPLETRGAYEPAGEDDILVSTLSMLISDGLDSPFSSIQEAVGLVMENASPKSPCYPLVVELRDAAEKLASTLGAILQLGRRRPE